MSIISSIMIAFILSFNSVISGINKEENLENEELMRVPNERKFLKKI